jgi:hypothetical protein
MDISSIITVVVVLVVVGAILAWIFIPRQRTKKLQEKFGPEYDYTVNKAKGQHEAETELEERQERVKAFSIAPLSPEASEGFSKAWQAVQAHFVDQPAEAVVEADRLVNEAMEARGYPMANFEQRAADVSVDHPTVVTNYRAAHEIVLKNEQSDANTEELRQAMVHYRALFEDLLEVQEINKNHKEAVAS